MTLAFLHKSRDNLSLFRSINEEIQSASEVTGACTCQLGCLWERAEGESAISVPTNVLARWESQHNSSVKLSIFSRMEGLLAQEVCVEAMLKKGKA